MGGYFSRLARRARRLSEKGWLGQVARKAEMGRGIQDKAWPRRSECVCVRVGVGMILE